MFCFPLRPLCSLWLIRLRGVRVLLAGVQRTARKSPRVRSIGPNVGVPRRPALMPTVPSS